jgi:hypothetical protein
MPLTKRLGWVLLAVQALLTDEYLALGMGHAVLTKRLGVCSRLRRCS